MKAQVLIAGLNLNERSNNLAILFSVEIVFFHIPYLCKVKLSSRHSGHSIKKYIKKRMRKEKG